MALPIKGLEEAFIRYLRKRGIAATEIDSLDERKEIHGWCETCSYEQMIVDIWYKIEDGTCKSYEYSGSLSYLIDELTDED